MTLEDINHATTSVASHRSVNIRASWRISMDDYYGRAQVDGASSNPEDPPPTYEPIHQPAQLRRKFNVQPREDEGREALPGYSCAISLEGVFLRKLEIEGAVHRALDRNWYKVIVSLQGTALTIRKCKGGWLPKTEVGRSQSPNGTAGAKQGDLVKSYNLQHAEVGVAADYMKKRFVIRVRAEADQFLLSCGKIETYIQWLQSLFAAIDLAPPLEDRDLPRDMSAPRPRGHRLGSPARQEAQIVRAQHEAMDRQHPVSVPPQHILPYEISSVAESQTEDECESQARTDPQSRPQPLRRQSSMIPLIMNACASPSGSSRRNPNPNVCSSTGKWAPQPPRTPWTEMQYACRCMGTLYSCSPRKSQFVIMMGKRWVVDWSTGQVSIWVPPADPLPEYDDEVLKIIMEDQQHDLAAWRHAQYGESIRI